jgi:hypothetical protein
MNIYVSIVIILVASLLAFAYIRVLPVLIKNHKIDNQKIDLKLVKSELTFENKELIDRLKTKLTREVESTMNDVDFEEYEKTIDQLFHFLGEVDRTFNHIVDVEDDYVAVEGLTRLKKDLKNMIRYDIIN